MPRNKNILVLSLFIIATTVSIWILGISSPNLHTLMMRTHKHISDLQRMNGMTMNKEEEKRMGETYLEVLGFTKNPHLYPNSVDRDLGAPVVVTAVRSRHYNNAFGLVDSAKRHLGDIWVVIFDLGIKSYELLELKKHCNATNQCLLRTFDFDKFPAHVRDFSIQAYKPVVIQEALNDYGAIVWCDTPEYFITSDLDLVLEQAQRSGIAAWTIESQEPTSALTHHKMFTYFKTQPVKYYFQHMVRTDQLIVYNTRKIHKQLMLSWVHCALTVDCIRPRGAQHTGCHHTRRPRYLYSGCHSYDASALNVILGIMFDQNETEYLTHYPVFGTESPETVLGENTTTKDSPGR